ncbi:tyrosine-type recombinase/integrase [Agromyces sp. SYSU K20354]|uniref:tyrosine-type recombinase/integrase n=1 Tax=Agromyces cavernae TaxID=2898659 RepID=UPI001E469DCD|nr:tyrosine-type recombinase/integrase [Agromyces cavernae]MCD2443457.1 tyrosine-type recombinase/integrase [Agromyces cavernae]
MTTETKRKYKSNPESWGRVRQRPSGRWQASYKGPDGKVHNAPHTFDAKVDAQAFNAARRVDIQRGVWKSPATLAAEAEAESKRADAERFGAYAATWVEQRVSGKGQPLRPKTRAEYVRQLDKGLHVFTNDRLAEITPARVRAWHNERAKTAKTAAGAEARLLRAILNTAVVDGIIVRNPVPANLTRSMTGRGHRPPTMDELAVILDTMPESLRLAVLLAAYGGLRFGEWRALRRSDIAVAGGRVAVSVTRAAQHINGHGWHVGAPKSDEGVRVVTLPSALTADVETHLSEHVGPFPESLVFAPTGRTQFLTDSAWNRAWNTARDAAGIRDQGVREHDLRHFAGSMFTQSGATMAEAMKLLGHSTMVAAMAYQHAAADRMTELADRMPLPPAAPKRVARIGN